MNILPGMAESFEEEYTYTIILALLKFIFGLVQAVCHCFKIYINTMNLKAGFIKYKLYNCLL